MLLQFYILKLVHTYIDTKYLYISTNLNNFHETSSSYYICPTTVAHKQSLFQVLVHLWYNSIKVVKKKKKGEKKKYLTFNIRIRAFMDSWAPIQSPNSPSNIHYKVSTTRTSHYINLNPNEKAQLVFRRLIKLVQNLNLKTEFWIKLPRFHRCSIPI